MMASFMNENRFPCKDCDNVFYTERNLKKHRRAQHGNPCIHCGKSVKHAKKYKTSRTFLRQKP